MSGQTAPGAAADRLAAHALALDPDRAPPVAQEALRVCLLDTLSVGIAGARAPYAPALTRAAEGWGAPGIGGEAHVWGQGRALPAGQAAFVNAFQVHAQEFDCVHEGAVLHPFTVVTPALLAEAEARPFSGALLLAGLHAGVDVAVTLGVAATSQIRFFRPATCGLFGAIAALARVRGLTHDETVSAFGYGLAFASGTMQAHVEGTPALAVAVGAAAQNALRAVDLAQAGLPGPRGSIDGPFGYLNLFEASHDLAPALEALGQVWRAAEVALKPHPTGRAAHGGITMALELRAQGVTAETLAQLTIEAPPLIHHLVGRPAPAEGPLEVNYARLCLPFLAARALLTGGLGLADFTPESLADPAARALAKRVEVQVVPNPDSAAFVPQRAIATLTDGRRLEVTLTQLPGGPQRPLNPAARRAKAQACAEFGLCPADGAAALAHLEAAVAGLARLTDAGQLSRIAAGALP